MTIINPPIKERETEDLLIIVTAESGIWQDEAVKQAKDELRARGVTDEEINDVRKNLDELGELEKKRFEENATESYPIWQMLIILLGAPLIVFNAFGCMEYMRLSDLKMENYKKKYRQRLLLLIGGCLLYLILIKIGINNYP